MNNQVAFASLHFAKVFNCSSCYDLWQSWL